MPNIVQQLEAELFRIALFQAAVGTIVTVVMLWVLYLVIKAGVRDGMKEAMQEGRVRRQVSTSHLPDMRAD